MKKKLLILAVAGFALASCSSDETTVSLANSGANEISFRPLNNGMTRAAEKSAFAANDVINVWCTKGASSYFNNATFTYAAVGYSGFSSNPPYYWPSTIDASDNKVTFYATYAGTQTAAGAISSFTPADEAASQVDLLCSKLECTAKPASGEATLAFKHALSEIIVKAKNSNSNLKIYVDGVKVGYVAHTGALNFTTGSPVWTNTNPTGPAVAADVYSQTWASANLLSSSLTDLTNIPDGADEGDAPDTEPWMILPQNLAFSQSGSGVMEYTKAYKEKLKGSASSAANLDCAYIALQLTFQDASTNADVVAKQWCYWPISTTWLAGKKYTYIIDAAQGGYQPTNIDDDAGTDASKNLDRVLEGLEIRFNTSTSIETWVSESDIDVSM